MSSEDNPKTPDESGNIRPEIQKKSEPEITKIENIGDLPKNEKLKMTFVVCPILSDLSHFPVEFQLAPYEMEVLLCMF